MSQLRFFSLAALAVLHTGAHADDWPRWRGPNGDNVSTETGWSSAPKDEPAWLANVGRGYSAPVIADGRVFTTGYFDGDEEGKGVDRVTCLDEKTGETVWSHEYAALIYANEHGGGALGTAIVHEGVLYVPSRAGEVRTYGARDGELLWEVDLVERHAVEPGRYGFASSPFVVGPNLVLNAERTVMLDRASGETVWISDSYGANYSTVAPIRLGERACLVTFGAKGLVVIDAKDGSHVHTYVFRKTERNVEGATPIVLGTRVLISSAYDHGAALVDFGGEEPEEVWRSRRMRSKMAGTTLFDGFLYGFDESMLKCMDLEGKEHWRVRGLGQGALTIADGRLLTTTSRGELVVAAASPAGFEEQSRTKWIDDGVFWTAPVLANGQVFLRGSLGELVCLDHRATPVADAGAAGADADAAGLPSAGELVAAHLAKTGLDAKPGLGLRMTGKLHNDALGLANVGATWETASAGRWHIRFDLPPGIGGSIERFFDGEIGWEVNPYRGAKLIDDGKVTELKQTAGLRSLFTPLPRDAKAETVGRASFHGMPCYRVDVAVTPERTREVYFAIETGLLAGRTAKDESTVLFGDWRKSEGLLLPFHRTVFDPDMGQEWRWRFDACALETPAPEAFEVPESIREALAKKAEEKPEQKTEGGGD